MTDSNAQQPYEPPAGQPQQPPAPAGSSIPTPAAPAPPLSQAEDKQWAMWAHLGGAISFLALFFGWIGLLAIVPSLVIFLVFGKRGALTRQESKEALNFQITVVAAIIIWSIISAIVMAVLGFSLILSGGFGAYFGISIVFAIIGWLLVAFDVVFSIVGAVKVNRGGAYRYPFAIRFVK